MSIIDSNVYDNLEREELKELEKKLNAKNWEKQEKHFHYKDNPKSYAFGTNKYKMCWLFVCGSMLGYVAEIIWYYYLRGRLVNRQGVLFGPFSPIYGIMFVLLTLLLYKIREKGWLRIFLISMIAVSTFEYVCSYAMEKILGTKAWSYTKQPYNLDGRICLKMSLMWGALGLLYIKVIYPIFSKTIENFSDKIGEKVGTVLCVFLVINCLFSLRVSIRQDERRSEIPAKNIVEVWIDHYYTDEKLSTIYSEIRVVHKN